MNYLRTAILLAGLTALFMAVGYLIGGGTGMMIALVIAAATNLFSYWNSDKLVLSMHQAQEVDEQSAPEFVAIASAKIAGGILACAADRHLHDDGSKRRQDWSIAAGYLKRQVWSLGRWR